MKRKTIGRPKYHKIRTKKVNRKTKRRTVRKRRRRKMRGGADMMKRFKNWVGTPKRMWNERSERRSKQRSDLREAYQKTRDELHSGDTQAWAEGQNLMPPLESLRRFRRDSQMEQKMEEADEAINELKKREATSGETTAAEKKAYLLLVEMNKAAIKKANQDEESAVMRDAKEQLRDKYSTRMNETFWLEIYSKLGAWDLDKTTEILDPFFQYLSDRDISCVDSLEESREKYINYQEEVARDYLRTLNFSEDEINLIGAIRHHGQLDFDGKKLKEMKEGGYDILDIADDLARDIRRGIEKQGGELGPVIEEYLDKADDATRDHLRDAGLSHGDIKRIERVMRAGELVIKRDKDGVLIPTQWFKIANIGDTNELLEKAKQFESAAEKEKYEAILMRQIGRNQRRLYQVVKKREINKQCQETKEDGSQLIGTMEPGTYFTAIPVTRERSDMNLDPGQEVRWAGSYRVEGDEEDLIPKGTIGVIVGYAFDKVAIDFPQVSDTQYVNEAELWPPTDCPNQVTMLSRRVWVTDIVVYKEKPDYENESPEQWMMDRGNIDESLMSWGRVGFVKVMTSSEGERAKEVPIIWKIIGDADKKSYDVEWLGHPDNTLPLGKNRSVSKTYRWGKPEPGLNVAEAKHKEGGGRRRQGNRRRKETRRRRKSRRP